jgi:hypothetical protein
MMVYPATACCRSDRVARIVAHRLVYLGFGRIVFQEKKVPILLVNMV